VRLICYAVSFTASVVWLYKSREEILNIKFAFVVVTLPFVTIMSSGYMWTTIRKPPFIARIRNEPQFFSPEFQMQNGVEPFIIAAICKSLN
jgi:hypothetical protein